MNWIRAMVIELFAILAIICLQLLGFFWKPKHVSHSIEECTEGMAHGSQGKKNSSPLVPGMAHGSQGRKKPILLVHGYINTSAVWVYLQKKLQTYGSVYTIDLKHPFVSISEYAEQVRNMALKIEEETGRSDLILIGYSMGGLVSAYYATKWAPKETEIMTISTPFEGTHIANIAFGKNAKEMRRGSPFLKKLNQEMLHSNIRLSNIASRSDEIIVPYTSSLVAGARQYVINDLGHGSLIFSSRVASKLIEWILQSPQ